MLLQLVQCLAQRLDAIHCLVPILVVAFNLVGIALLCHDIRRRLATYELTNRVFQRKYGMTLAEFEAANIVAKQGYSYKVESDHQDWDQAVDGIETLRETLHKLQEQQ